jgi:hypothetical protein
VTHNHLNSQNLGFKCCATTAGEIASLDPNLKPYSMRQFIARLDHRLTKRITAGVRYTHNDLLHVIEDIGVLGSNNNSVFFYGNPGEGLTRTTIRGTFSTARRPMDRSSLCQRQSGSTTASSSVWKAASTS